MNHRQNATSSTSRNTQRAARRRLSQARTIIMPSSSSSSSLTMADLMLKQHMTDKDDDRDLSDPSLTSACVVSSNNITAANDTSDSGYMNYISSNHDDEEHKESSQRSLMSAGTSISPHHCYHDVEKESLKREVDQLREALRTTTVELSGLADSQREIDQNELYEERLLRLKLKDEVRILQDKLKQCENENEELIEDIMDSSNNIEELRHQLKQTQEENASLQKKCNKLQAERDGLADELCNIHAYEGDRELLRESLRHTKQCSLRDLQKLNKEKKELEERYEQIVKERNDLEHENSTLRQRLLLVVVPNSTTTNAASTDNQTPSQAPTLTSEAKPTQFCRRRSSSDLHNNNNNRRRRFRRGSSTVIMMATEKYNSLSNLMTKHQPQRSFDVDRTLSSLSNRDNSGMVKDDFCRATTRKNIKDDLNEVNETGGEDDEPVPTTQEKTIQRTGRRRKRFSLPNTTRSPGLDKVIKDVAATFFATSTNNSMSFDNDTEPSAFQYYEGPSTITDRSICTSISCDDATMNNSLSFDSNRKIHREQLSSTATAAQQQPRFIQKLSASTKDLSSSFMNNVSSTWHNTSRVAASAAASRRSYSTTSSSPRPLLVPFSNTTNGGIWEQQHSSTLASPPVVARHLDVRSRSVTVSSSSVEPLLSDIMKNEEPSSRRKHYDPFDLENDLM